MFNFILLNVFILNVIMLNIFILNVIMLNVIMLSVMAPLKSAIGTQFNAISTLLSAYTEFLPQVLLTSFASHFPSVIK